MGFQKIPARKLGQKFPLEVWIKFLVYNNKEKRMSEEKENMTAIIGIRVPPFFKQWAKEMAEMRGETLTDFLWELVNEGGKQMFPELFT